MLTLDWRQDLRAGFKQDAQRAKDYLEAILEDAAEDGYTDVIAPAVEDVVAARGVDSARSLIDSLEAGRQEHRDMMLTAVDVYSKSILIPVSRTQRRRHHTYAPPRKPYIRTMLKRVAQSMLDALQRVFPEQLNKN